MRLSRAPPPDLRLSLAAFLAHVGELQAGYLFLPFPDPAHARWVEGELAPLGVGVRRLEGVDEAAGALLRTRARGDGERLLALLEGELGAMPGALERFRQPTPEVTVAKELVFDAAHFITDHPAKCSNLHGGRYVLRVKVRDRIDPVRGCVGDSGYLSRVATRRVVERFDHHTLNYAAPELAWRSSTEILCVFVWEQLIDYLPGLVELELHETPQSWCSYRGPRLEEREGWGGDALLGHFADPALGRSPLRELIGTDPPRLQAVAGS
jgi:6-pyruvoyl tetrahydropterin synthase/QueD family protein